MSQSAPIVLFAYKRPEHTRRTVEALKANPGADRSELYLFSDGPKNEADREAVDEVRSYLRTVTGFARVQLEESPVNRGLEISSDAADGEDSYITTQVTNGIAVRMAVLFLLTRKAV